MSVSRTFALVIDHAITENDPITNLPWPPPEPGRWELVCGREADRTSVLRRIACREAERG